MRTRTCNNVTVVPVGRPISNGVTTAYIALGSNLGDKRRNIKDAIRMIRRLQGTSVTAVSGLYRTPAEGRAYRSCLRQIHRGGQAGNIQQPNFINAAIEIKTSLSAQELLDKLSAIEKTLGRVRVDGKLLPRTIDLDILLYGQKVYRLKRLTVPHPRMHRRRFVLEPLCELAPDLVHPVLKKPIRDLLKKI
ncbi:MAG: 2-amino-4-hydroxy-6-hydroxymethyldihydropteridine diphosphokinase [Planctomycetota bacterium]